MEEHPLISNCYRRVWIYTEFRQHMIMECHHLWNWSSPASTSLWIFPFISPVDVCRILQGKVNEKTYSLTEFYKILGCVTDLEQCDSTALYSVCLETLIYTCITSIYLRLFYLKWRFCNRDKNKWIKNNKQR